MSYKLGRHSLSQLEGVHPELKRVIHEAIKRTSQDFTVHDGVRTAQEQFVLYRKGASKLDGYERKSKHQPQDDGFGHAVDLVPWVNGRLRWEWSAIYPIARAVKVSALICGVAIRWGGSWERLDTDDRDPETMVKDYVEKRRSQGRSAFTDGPHYEIVLT